MDVRDGEVIGLAASPRGIPRIARAVPQGPVTTTDQPIAVVATMHWASGSSTVEPAEAIAWTRDAVEVRWTPPRDDQPRTDWIPAVDVQRLGAPVRPRPALPPPPRSTNVKRPRW